MEKAKNYSEIVKEVNFDRRPRPGFGTATPQQAEPSRREKMLEFARQIPRPLPKRPAQMTRSPSSSVQGAEASHPTKQLEFLENQHLLYQQKLKDLKIN